MREHLTASRRLTLLALLLAAAGLAGAGPCADCLGGKSVEFTVRVDAGREQVKQLRGRTRPLTRSTERSRTSPPQALKMLS